jgi:hypothetical protein
VRVNEGWSEQEKCERKKRRKKRVGSLSLQKNEIKIETIRKARAHKLKIQNKN